MNDNISTFKILETVNIMRGVLSYSHGRSFCPFLGSPKLYLYIFLNNPSKIFFFCYFIGEYALFFHFVEKPCYQVGTHSLDYSLQIITQ